MNPVVHFEMPTHDRDRMSTFYSQAFGWKIRKLGEEMGNYTLVQTAEADDQGMPTRPGTINGGFYPVKDEVPKQTPSLVIGVDDINQSMETITRAGGEVIGHPVEIPGYGHYVSFYDTEGNRLSIMEPTPENKQKAQHQSADFQESRH